MLKLFRAFAPMMLAAAFMGQSEWLLPVAGAALLPACGDDCEARQCADLTKGTSLSSNSKTYHHCMTCDSSGSCSTTLEDESRKSFFSCTDEPGKTCSGQTVDAEFAYCDLH